MHAPDFSAFSKAYGVTPECLLIIFRRKSPEFNYPSDYTHRSVFLSIFLIYLSTLY
jgi:hypothetical protein